MKGVLGSGGTRVRVREHDSERGRGPLQRWIRIAKRVMELKDQGMRRRKRMEVEGGRGPYLHSV